MQLLLYREHSAVGSH